MRGYGKAAVMAVDYYISGEAQSPLKAWMKATRSVFRSHHSITKGCPKSAFLGLCEDGMVSGIPPGNYTSGWKNKKYAVNAAKYLLEHAPSYISEAELWDIARQGVQNPAHNHSGQVSIVLALWRAGKLVRP